jgi:hypothetical protein
VFPSHSIRPSLGHHAVIQANDQNGLWTLCGSPFGFGGRTDPATPRPCVRLAACRAKGPVLRPVNSAGSFVSPRSEATIDDAEGRVGLVPHPTSALPQSGGTGLSRLGVDPCATLALSSGSRQRAERCQSSRSAHTSAPLPNARAKGRMTSAQRLLSTTFLGLRVQIHPSPAPS